MVGLQYSTLRRRSAWQQPEKEPGCPQQWMVRASLHCISEDVEGKRLEISLVNFEGIEPRRRWLTLVRSESVEVNASKRL